jgi:hypothetical protein
MGRVVYGSLMAFSIALPAVAEARQGAVVSGVVTSDNGGTPIAGARVLLAVANSRRPVSTAGSRSPASDLAPTWSS